MAYKSADPSIRPYLRDIRKTSPYCRKDEQELFRLYKEGNPKARAKILNANMRFVLKVALQYQNCSVPLSDLVSEGAMGLIRALDSFDYTRGLKFISYAVWWIRAYITKAIIKRGSLIRLPANQHLKVLKALNKSAKGESLNEEIRELIQLGQKGSSLDSPIESNSQTTFSDIFADTKAENPDMNVELNSVEQFTRKILSELPEREARILKSLYGIGYESPQSLREVGEYFDISHERVRQLRNQAHRRLRKGGLKNILREKLDGYIEASTNLCTVSE